jgi:hypothetical protein
VVEEADDQEARVRIIVYLAIAAAMASLTIACGGTTPTSPTPPTPTPTSVTVRITDGLTSQTIASSGTLTYRNGIATAQIVNGSAVLENAVSGDRVTISGVPGYRERNTLYCGRDTFMLWRNQPGDVDEELTRVAYTTNRGDLVRPDAVFLVLSDELRANPTVVALHEQGAAIFAAAVQGKTPISVVASASNPGGATFTVSVNPAIPHSGITTFSSTSGKVTDGRIEYRSLFAAGAMGLVLHEIARTLGMNASSPYPGLMNISPTGTDFTPAEKNMLLLRYTRPVGALFQGDNDQAALNGCR